MLRFVKHIVWLLGVMIGCQSALGFALLGPPLTAGLPDTFQTGTIGYNPGGSDGANPRDIQEEYRRNTPVIYYAFDAAFLSYFGSNGIIELDKAMAMYNSIGKTTQLDPNDYPEDSRRVNFRAQAAGLIDLKSFIMGLLSKEVGLFEPTRWVWALHDRQVFPGPPPCPANVGYQVFHRNFSITPVGTDTYPTTTYVNGVLYSYFIQENCTGPDPLADAIEFPVDPLSSPYSAVADFTSFWYSGLPNGGFYTSLTRDDVAGIKYLLATNNINNEASGPRTTEFLTNNTPAVIQTQDLGLFAIQARTNTAAGLAALYPGLIVTSTSNFFGLTVTTNITASLVGSPLDPAGLPPSHTVLSTNYTTNFANFFVHTFANLVTNTYATRGVVGVITLGVTNDPVAIAGTAVTTNLFLTPFPIIGVFGDFFILPTNVCGAQVLSNLLTQVTATTNLPTVTVGPTTNSITFTPGSVTFSTNHLLVYLPVTCPIDSIAPRGGVDRIQFVRRDYDSLTSQIWDPVTNDYTLTELNVTNSTLSLKHFQRRAPRPDFLLVRRIWRRRMEILRIPIRWMVFPPALYSALPSSARHLSSTAASISISGVVQAVWRVPAQLLIRRFCQRFLFSTSCRRCFFNFSAPLGPFLIPGELSQVGSVAFGSFDGTTNAPVVYPNGTLSRRFGKSDPWAVGDHPVPPEREYWFALFRAACRNRWHGSLYVGASAEFARPAGVRFLNISSDGKITGTPSGPASIYDFTVRLTDSAGVFRDVQFTITGSSDAHEIRPDPLKKVSPMKRVLLSSLLVLTVGRPAFAYVNDRVVQVPTMDRELIQIDDPIFVNNNFFSVDTTLFQSGLQAPIFMETSSTLYVTNTGTLVSIPGFDFENFPASVGKPEMLANFENIANGFGGGVIAATNIFFGQNIFQNAGTFNNTFNWDLTGFATVKVRATNVVDSGLITVDSTGLIDITGKDMNFDSARFELTGGGGVNVIDWGGGGFGTNSSGWSPAGSLTPFFASSPLFTNNSGVTIEQESLFLNSTPNVENLNPQPDANSNIVWRVVFLQDNSPTNVTPSVFFGGFGFGDGAFHIQWKGVYRDPFTGGTATNYFLLSNEPAESAGCLLLSVPRSAGGLHLRPEPNAADCRKPRNARIQRRTVPRGMHQ